MFVLKICRVLLFSVQSRFMLAFNWVLDKDAAVCQMCFCTREPLSLSQ